MQMQETPGGNIERSNVGTIQTYGIKDPSIVMQTLSSLYQNPRKIVVQEYISNGRDAHREVGKNDVPVHVILPTDIDPNLRIRDFGPGLNSHRVTDVFCWFGESTKRDSNGQTGGFGIGAKCGFAYNSKSFTVTTVVDEDDGRVKRHYAAYLNEHEIPEFVSMSEEPSDDPVGVEVAIPINENEFSYIKKHIKEVTQFWDMTENSVRPLIKNDTIEYDEFIKLMEGEGWILYDTGKDSYYGRSGEPFVILDGIKYPIPTDAYEGLDSEIACITRLNIALLFNTGEIYPAANRENLKFNDQIKNLICERLTECFNMVKQDMQAQIINSKNLYEANLKWKELDHHIGSRVVGAVEWKGFKIRGQKLNAPGTSKVYYYEQSEYKERNRLVTKKSDHLKWIPDSLIVYNDEHNTARPSPNRIKTIFKTFPDVKLIQVIHCNSSEDFKEWKEKGFDYFGCEPITKWEKIKIKLSNPGDRIVSKCFVHGDLIRYPRRTFWHSINVDVKNDAGIYVTFNRGVNIEGYSDNRLEWIKNKYGIEILGIPCRYINKAKTNPRMIPLDKWLDNKYLELVNNFPNRSKLSLERVYMENTNIFKNMSWGMSRFLNSKELLSILPKSNPLRRLIRLRKIVERYSNSRKEEKEYYQDVAMLACLTQRNTPMDENFSNSELKKLYDECQVIINDLHLLKTISWDYIYLRTSFNIIMNEDAYNHVIYHLIEYVKNNI